MQVHLDPPLLPRHHEPFVPTRAAVIYVDWVTHLSFSIRFAVCSILGRGEFVLKSQGIDHHQTGINPRTLRVSASKDI